MHARFLEATKAFAKLKRNKLCGILGRDGCPLIFRLLLNMYLVCRVRVCWSGTLSRLNISDTDCFMSSLCANAFVHADVIVNSTCSASKRLIIRRQNYGVEDDLTFSPTKCALLIFVHEDNRIKDVTGSMFERCMKSISAIFLSTTGNVFYF